MSDAHRTIIPAISIVEQARVMAAVFPLGVGMFTIPVYTGPEITHYCSTGLAPEFVVNNLPYRDKAGVMHEGNLPALAEQLTERGLPTEVADLEAMLEHIDISEDEWPVAFERLGLTKEPA